MKGDGSAWPSELIKLMRDLGFTMCRAGGDVWMVVAADTSYIGSTTDDGMPAGKLYYGYVFIHVDNLIVARLILEQVMQSIIKTYRLNKDK